MNGQALITLTGFLWQRKTGASHGQGKGLYMDWFLLIGIASRIDKSGHDASSTRQHWTSSMMLSGYCYTIAHESNVESSTLCPHCFQYQGCYNSYVMFLPSPRPARSRLEGQYRFLLTKNIFITNDV